MSAPLPILCAVLLAGCTAVKSTVDLTRAESRLHQAAAQQAPTLAPYEYTLAAQYLEKAREEQGYSQHKVASALALRAEEWADRAVVAIDQGRLGIGAPDPELHDALPEPAPAIAPAPSASEPDAAPERAILEPGAPTEPGASEPGAPTEPSASEPDAAPEPDAAEPDAAPEPDAATEPEPAPEAAEPESEPTPQPPSTEPGAPEPEPAPAEAPSTPGIWK